MENMHKSVTIALVAGEMSGDVLGGGLIQALREHYPYAKFVGVGGPEMIAQGLECWYPMETLSVMGIAAVLKRLPSLLELRKNLVRRIVKQQPLVFIGIDAPDFNLGLAKRLKSARIRTVHYVSPSVWAWRQGRVVGIAQSIDLMLTLFPFEREFFVRHGVASAFVGHPAADDIPLVPSQSQYRDRVQTKLDALCVKHGVPALSPLSDSPVLAVLPGSRRGEVEYLWPVFSQTLFWLHAQRPNLRFIVACANEERRVQIQSMLDATPDAQKLPVELLVGGARSIMGASDAVLLASGTATLEAMLLKKPMVVAYKWHWLTHFIISRLVKIDNVALPNILAGELLVPELIQNKAIPSLLGPAVLDSLSAQKKSVVASAFTKIHQTLSGDASARAAEAIVGLLATPQAREIQAVHS